MNRWQALCIVIGFVSPSACKESPPKATPFSGYPGAQALLPGSLPAPLEITEKPFHPSLALYVDDELRGEYAAVDFYPEGKILGPGATRRGENSASSNGTELLGWLQSVGVNRTPHQRVVVEDSAGRRLDVTDLTESEWYILPSRRGRLKLMSQLVYASAMKKLGKGPGTGGGRTRTQGGTQDGSGGGSGAGTGKGTGKTRTGGGKGNGNGQGRRGTKSAPLAVVDTLAKVHVYSGI